MSETNQSQLHKEFELERMILFSDAVFAIAITLLIIEIKFPEIHDAAHVSLVDVFKPIMMEAMGFLVSFVFIGGAWVSHLKTFRYLRAYDNGVIFRNLVMLFFVVTFPFSASAITKYKPGFSLPILIYIANVALVFIANFVLAHYIFKTNPSLTIQQHEVEKKYLLLRSKAMAIVFPIAFLIMLVASLVSHQEGDGVMYSFYAAALLMFAVSRWVKSRKPKGINV